LNGCSWSSNNNPSQSQEQKMPITIITYEELLSGMKFTG
jgi:hypothetical protein